MRPSLPVELAAAPRGVSAAARSSTCAGSRRSTPIPHVIPGAMRRAARRRSPTWARDARAVAPGRRRTACTGTRSAQDAAAALRARGFDARYLEGGLDGWRAEGGATAPYAAPTRWVTRERPKIDRIACPWLVRRFIDPAAEFFYVPNAEVRAFAAANGATAYDIPDVDVLARRRRSAASTRSSASTGSTDPALDALATIVRGADTSALDLAPQAPGLLAVSLGLSAMFADDHAMLKWGMLVYDALYAWCREAQAETHGWYPEKLRVRETA